MENTGENNDKLTATDCDLHPMQEKNINLKELENL